MEGKAHSTVDFLEGNLCRFLWYAEREGWPDDARAVDAWKLRKFLSSPIADRRSPLLTWQGAAPGSEVTSYEVLYSLKTLAKIR